MANNAKFEVIGKPYRLDAGNGKIIVVSRQKITQENGNSSDHVVISKIRENSDGTQNGKPKTLFLPYEYKDQIGNLLITDELSD